MYADAASAAAVPQHSGTQQNTRSSLQLCLSEMTQPPYCCAQLPPQLYKPSPAIINPLCVVGMQKLGHVQPLFALTMQRLQQSGELLEQHTDPLTNTLARQQHGVTKGSVDAAVAHGKIPLLLTDVEGAQAARAAGLDCWCIFMAPASPEVQHTPQDSIP